MTNQMREIIFEVRFFQDEFFIIYQHSYLKRMHKPTTRK